MPERPLAGQARVSYPKAGTAQERATPNTIPYSQFFSSKNLSSYSESRNQRPRTSVFEELDVDAMPEAPTGGLRGDVMHEIRPSQPLHTDSFSSVQSDDSSYDAEGSRSIDKSQNGWFESWQAFSSSRLMMLSLILLVTMPLLYDTPLLGKAGPSIFGAAAGVIETPNIQKKAIADRKLVVPRANTDTDVCKRWSHQSALVNGTLYLYGGRATKDASQSTDEWNNDFLTIDVTKSWDISSPVNAGLPQPSGPPPVSNGYLWNSYKSLFLYGGEFQDQPATTPVAYSLWEYSISSASWIEHQKPQTSNGNSSDGGNQPVMGLAEGAGVSVPQLGRGYYFGGHQDAYTTPGWSVQVERLYLKSLLELTFPGYTNNGVQSLSGGKLAGNDGVWRNITQGGIQDTARFASRADSGLVYVPGYGVNGILVSIGGGINITFVSIAQLKTPLLPR